MANCRPIRMDHVVATVIVALALAVAFMLLVPSNADAASYGLRTVRVSGTALAPTNAGSYWGSVSSGARHVAFQSYATNLAPGGGGGADIFIRDTRSASMRCASVGLNGATPDGSSVSPSIRSDGQIVAFASNATNLVAGDTNGSWDVFIRNLANMTTSAVSVSPVGAAGNGDSSQPAISADGRRIAFVSASSNLAPGDNAGLDDIFVRDLTSGVTIRVSVGLLGAEANGHSSAPCISADGSRVAFVSRASNLVAGDTNNASDVFVVDVATLAITRASVKGSSTQANLGSYAPAISGSGKKVAFESLATNLVSRDTNDVRDVFVRDLSVKTTVRASVSSSEKQAVAESREPSLSYSGSKVTFSSASNNLVGRDTNGRSDAFLRNLSSGNTTRLSTGPSGQAKSPCGGAVLAADGYHAVYQTTSSNMVPSDRNARSDIFVAAWGRRGYDRVQGDSVYATAVQASRRAAPHGAPAVVIANGSDWRAAIAGASLAGATKGTLLYATKSSLPAVTRDEIIRLGASRVYVVGGTDMVPSTVASALATVPGIQAVERVGSGSGYTVANAVASRVVSIKGSSFNGTVLVVSGKGYTASIAAVPLAAGTGRPMVFVNPSTGSYRLPSGVKRAIIIGGTGSVPRSVESKLRRKLGTSRVARYTGASRYSAAVAVAKKSVSMNHTWDGVTVVNISKPTEAICGAVMAGRTGSVVLYTPRTGLASATKSRLTSSRYRIDSVRIVGSTSSVSSTVLSAIRKALGG